MRLAKGESRVPTPAAAAFWVRFSPPPAAHLDRAPAARPVHYYGCHHPAGAQVTVVAVPPSGRARPSEGVPLPWRLDLRRRSPTGLEWGYHGSGPAQLALALLAHATADIPRALALYQDYKEAVVARLPDCWVLTAQSICDWAIGPAGPGPSASQEQA